jgi:hypothetical protein
VPAKAREDHYCVIAARRAAGIVGANMAPAALILTGGNPGPYAARSLLRWRKYHVPSYCQFVQFIIGGYPSSRYFPACTPSKTLEKNTFIGALH